MKSLIVIFLLVAFTSLSAPSAFAVDPGAYVGVATGASFVDHSYGNRFAVGGHLGYQLNDYLALGFYGMYENLGTGTSGPNSSAYSTGVKETILAIEGNFYPNPAIPFYVGGKVGLARSTESTPVYDQFGNLSNQTETDGNFVVGPAFGVDFPVTAFLSLGGEFNTLYIVSSSSDTIHLVNVLATATLHF